MQERLVIALLEWLLLRLLPRFEEFLVTDGRYEFFEDALSNFLSQKLPIISQFQESHDHVHQDTSS